MVILIAIFSAVGVVVQVGSRESGVETAITATMAAPGDVPEDATCSVIAAMSSGFVVAAVGCVVTYEIRETPS